MRPAPTRLADERCYRLAKPLLVHPVVLIVALAVTGDTWAQCQAAKLTSSNAAAGDVFGVPAVSGNLAVIGSPFDHDGGFPTGSAYVFRYELATSQWLEEAELTASDGEANDGFGGAVSVWRQLVLVGSPGDGDGCPCGSGSVYVFRFDGKRWIEEAKLTASDASFEDRFGSSVSISGDVALIGSPGDGDDGSNSGSTYVFHYDTESGMWAEKAKLTASDAGAGDQFGREVSIDADVALIGALLDDDGGNQSGSAYVFRFDGTTCVEEAKLTASDAAPDDRFGRSVSIAGDVALIGAYFDDDAGDRSGSAYVFRYNRTTGTWDEEAKLTASDAEAGDRFGARVDLSPGGVLAVIGAVLDDDACPSDPNCDSGSAYLFSYDPVCGTWIEKAKFTAADAQAGDQFGHVSLTDDVAVIGATLDDDAGPTSGSAYIFDLDGADCNGNIICDSNDIANGTSLDANGNGIPDKCECPPDVNGDGAVNVLDLIELLLCFGQPAVPGCEAEDVNNDGAVNVLDLIELLLDFGSTCP